MTTSLSKSVFLLLCMLFSYERITAAPLECSGVFSNSTNTIESSPEDHVIQNVVANLKTFDSRLAQDLRNKSSEPTAVVLMSFLNREFNPIDEVYRNTLVSDLNAILSEYNKGEAEIYDIITKLQGNLKPSTFKKMFSRTSKMTQATDSLVNKIVTCRAGMHSCAVTVNERIPDFQRTHLLVQNLFAAYKSITEYLTSNHQQIINILRQNEESKDNAVLFFEKKLNSLQSQLSVIKIKKDQMEQQYVSAVDIVSLKYPEITNQIKLLISLGAPEKIESAFQETRITSENAVKYKSYIAHINSTQKLNLLQTKLEPKNYKVDLEIIEEQIRNAKELTTRDLLYVLSISIPRYDEYYKNSFIKYINQFSQKELQNYKDIASSYNFEISQDQRGELHYFERIMPILLHKWKPEYTQEEFGLRKHIQNAAIERTDTLQMHSHFGFFLRSLTDIILTKKLNEILEKVNGV